MGYGELPPPADLADRVACRWWRTQGDGAADAGHAVLPDGSVDLVWHAGRLIVAGPDTGPMVAPPSADGAVGVRLRPGAGAAFGVAASALRDGRVAADELWGAAGGELTERVGEAADDRARLALLVGAVRRRCDAAAPPDRAVAVAVGVLAGGGALGPGHRSGALRGRPLGPVATAAHAAGLSDRQLRRRFLDHVGYGPKTLDRVLRLQRFLTLAVGTREDLAGLAALAGYADQAHLAREARALADATPGALVAARRPATASETSKTTRPPAARMTA